MKTPLPVFSGYRCCVKLWCGRRSLAAESVPAVAGRPSVPFPRWAGIPARFFPCGIHTNRCRKSPTAPHRFPPADDGYSNILRFPAQCHCWRPQLLCISSRLSPGHRNKRFWFEGAHKRSANPRWADRNPARRRGRHPAVQWSKRCGPDLQCIRFGSALAGSDPLRPDTALYSWKPPA